MGPSLRSVKFEKGDPDSMISARGDAGFDDFAARYDQALEQGLSATGESKDYFAHGRIEWLVKKLDTMHVRASRVLDFGCGTGTSIPLLRSLPGVEEVTGVDTSEASLKMAAANFAPLGGIRFGTPELLAPVGDRDLVFCNGVFHHIPLADRAGAMEYIFDSLRPGGLFALWENNPLNPGTRYVMSKIAFDRDAILVYPWQTRELAESAGLEVVTTRFLFFFPKSLASLRPLEMKMERIPLGGQYVVLCRKPKPGRE
jgi:SAM-dependent methyltransferase